MANQEQQAKLAKTLGLHDPKGGTICPLCGETIDPNEFTDDLSRREYQISGICRKCMDDIFKEPEVAGSVALVEPSSGFTDS